MEKGFKAVEFAHADKAGKGSFLLHRFSVLIVFQFPHGIRTSGPNVSYENEELTCS